MMVDVLHFISIILSVLVSNIQTVMKSVHRVVSPVKTKSFAQFWLLCCRKYSKTLISESQIQTPKLNGLISHVARSVNFHYILFFALCCVDM